MDGTQGKWFVRGQLPPAGVGELSQGQIFALPGDEHVMVSVAPRGDDRASWVLVGKRRKYMIDRSGALWLRAVIDTDHLWTPDAPLLTDLTIGDLVATESCRRRR